MCRWEQHPFAMLSRVAVGCALVWYDESSYVRNPIQRTANRHTGVRAMRRS
jgi:hypothetical protein